MNGQENGVTPSWLRTNLGALITIIILVIGLVSQWVQMQNSVSLGQDTAARLRAHELDTDRHVDRTRDESRYQEMMRRLDRMENKLDSLKEVK